MVQAKVVATDGGEVVRLARVRLCKESRQCNARLLELADMLIDNRFFKVLTRDDLVSGMVIAAAKSCKSMRDCGTRGREPDSPTKW